MSRIRTSMRRYRFTLLGAAIIAGCSSGGTDNNNPGTIALGLNPTTGTVNQGSQTTVQATLTRGGGFTGNVDLTVTGTPTGVGATVANIVTSGTSTIATVTVTATASTVVGTYTLVVHGTGSGVTEATATYALTVTAQPAVAVALSSAALTAAQGSATATTTVTLTRTNFTGDVTLTVDNLPSGVTAAFAPANPQSTNSSVLTLTIAPTAPTGTFTTLAVRAAGAGITAATAPLSLTINAPQPDFQLSLTNGALGITQGANAPTTVNIARTNFTGPVTLSIAGNPLPTGVTVSFNPASPTTANSTVATVAVDGGVPPGVYNLSINGAGAPGNRSAPLVLTVVAGIPVGNFSLSTVPPTSVNVTRGGAAVPVTVNINRIGGNTSFVTLSTSSASALPAGLALAPFPVNPTGQPSSTFTITAATSVPAGTYPIVIHGNVANLAEQTVNLTINVTDPAGTGNVSVDFTGCSPANMPVWAAAQNGGFTAPWSVVTPVGSVYSFTVNAGQGGFTYVTQGTGGASAVIVNYMTEAEFTAGTLRLCGAVLTGRNITGTITGTPAGFITQVNFGNALGFAPEAVPTYTLNDAETGSHDLMMYSHPVGTVTAGDRIGLFRGQNPGPVIPPLNISTDVHSFSPLAALITVTGAGAGETFTHGMSYYSGATCDIASLYSGMAVTGTSFNAYGVPTTQQLPPDRHGMLVIGDDGAGGFRSLWETFHDLVAHSVLLPPKLPPGTTTETGTSYSILRHQFTSPQDYNDSFTWQHTQQSAPRSALVTASRGVFPTASIDLKIGQYSGLPGWLDSWAPAKSQAANTVVTASGGRPAGGFCSPVSTRFVTASIIGAF